MLTFQPGLYEPIENSLGAKENHKRLEKGGMSTNLEDGLWKSILNTQPETKQDFGTQEITKNKNERKENPEWEACQSSEPIFLSPGIKRRILDLALGEMVSKNLIICLRFKISLSLIERNCKHDSTAVMFTLSNNKNDNN